MEYTGFFKSLLLTVKQARVFQKKLHIQNHFLVSATTLEAIKESPQYIITFGLAKGL